MKKIIIYTLLAISAAMCLCAASCTGGQMPNVIVPGYGDYTSGTLTIIPPAPKEY